MRCDDFICLGRTVPEESKKYGAKVCMAGLSSELHGLLRVYPLPVVNPIRARHECVLEVQRNRQDSRVESWKLSGRGEAIVSVSPRPVLDHECLASALGPFRVRSIVELNDRRLSLGVLHLLNPRGFYRQRSGISHPDQGMLFEIADECFGAGAIDVCPYIEFWDDDAKRHELQIREWGCYEWIRKERARASQLWDNLHLREGKMIWAVVGNQANRRTSWLIIKTFIVRTETQRQFFADDDVDGCEPAAAGERLTPIAGDDGSWHTAAMITEGQRYARYLLSPEFDVLRRRVRERSGGVCERCHVSSAQAIHHLTYDRKYNEQVGDLLDVCHDCHRSIHGLDRAQVGTGRRVRAARMTGEGPRIRNG